MQTPTETDAPSLRALFQPRPRLIFMDCDGVIFDANALKCDAYRHALAGYPEAAVEALVAHHRAHGGVSRYEKLRAFFETLHPLPEPARDAAIARALDRFGAFSRDGYRRLTPRPEALAFVDALGGPERVVVVSGADGDELRGIFAAHGIAARFAAVLGSPTPKRAHVARVLAERGVAAADARFVGDGGGDWKTASALGVPFVLLTEMSAWTDGPATVADAPGAWIVTRWDALVAAATASDAAPFSG